MRLLAYADFRYALEDGRVAAEMPFALFLAGLAPFVDELTLLGRLQRSGDGPPPPHQLPEVVRLLGLPSYPAASQPWHVARALPGSLRRMWRALGEADAALVFGPHPLAAALVLVTLVRRRTVVLGVRQHYPDYVRHRHPGRRRLHAAAAGLEAAWKALSRFLPTAVVGPHLARSFRRARRLLPLTVALVHDGDVVPLERALRRDYGGELTVLAVGRLGAEKNPLLLADVLAELGRDGERWRLAVCGEGTLRPELEARLARLGVRDRAALLGYVPVEGGLGALYRESHFLLHVSLTEGMPQVLLEALASGLPVVATEVGGVGMGEERAAVALVPPRDAAAAAAALRELAGDAARRRRLVEAGLSLVRRHTLERECRLLVDFIAAARPQRGARSGAASSRG